MSVDRLRHLNEIHFYLAIEEAAIKLNVAAGDYSLNRLGENFVAKLLNKIYGWRLRNLNEDIPNHPAIDLGDETNKVSVQVTSEYAREKIQVDTIDKFIELGFHKTYTVLYVFLLGYKPDYQKEFDTKNSITFDLKKHILCFNDLIPVIEKLDVPVLEEIEQYLQTEIGSFLKSKSSPSWRCKLGQKHLYVRESVLQIKNLDQLANLYQIPVDEIEEYEGGEACLSDKVIEKLSEFFFINKGYFKEDDPMLFQIKHFRECTEQLLTQGFTPYFLFNIKDGDSNNDIPAKLVLIKREGRLVRIQITHPTFNFGGKHLAGTGYVIEIIQKIIRLNKRAKWTDAEFNSVTSSEWEALGAGTYYNPKLTFRPLQNAIPQDRFKEWFEEEHKQHGS